ncbi:CGNR zinc finger domain-containing protein [Antrihabitans spumae]|jgi:predicted RNA-binding Zn ribbon-like protein|uniref:CGNR zinc finger domain-containing protein n=1 Tax=Antrihabitans spumae TaxID=3373370 RepID=A0ABW7KMS1_9NOCA
MYFAHDTDHALVTTTALVNTLLGEDDSLSDPAALNDFLDEYEFTGRRDLSDVELQQVRGLRRSLRSVWDAADETVAVDIVNRMLLDSNARPRLTRHDRWDWHLHVTEADDALVDRIAAEAAMALVDVIRVGDLDRLKHCAAPDCDAVLIDLSRNRSRRYCDTGNCGNRANVAAYRARKAASGS